MRLILAATAATLLSACGGASVPASERAAVTAPADDARVLAVMSFAEWCGSCKALDPKVEAVQQANSFDGVAFTKIDYTSRDADAFFADAETLGIGETMRATFGDTIKTGRLYLVNLETGEVISTIDKSMDEAAITAAITDAAALS
ncbi:MAG: thioredoxin family protein [Alphaproteobacteria bacterium]|nr:thioredoxin family protein [Alphaproteobacteria bacterium]